MFRIILTLTLILSGTNAWAAQGQDIRLTFNDALMMANDRHAQIIMADERMEQALARLGQAASSLLPHLSASATDSSQTRDLRAQGIMLPNTQPHLGPFDSFDGRLHVTQSIFDAGALARLKAAAQGRELSSAQRLKIEGDVLALVAALYFNARRAQESLEASRVLLKLKMKHWQLARLQWSQGTASKLDVDVARHGYARSFLGWRQAHARLTQTRSDLCAALDLPMDAHIVFADDDLKSADFPKDIKQASILSPDVEVAKRQLSVLSAQKNAEQADWLPKVSALADYGTSGEDLGNASTTYTVGLQATIPIWEGGNRENRVREAKSKVREGQAHLDEVHRQTQARIWTALANIEQSTALIREAKAQLQLAQTRRQIAMERFQIGNGTSLDVLDAKADEVIAGDQIREAFTTYKLSNINLAHAMGRMNDLIRTPQGQEKL